MLDWSEYNRWLSSAIKTLESAEKDEDFNWACFKAEQSAQLAVRALLFLLGKPHVGHDLLTLLERTEVRLFSEILECASFLSKVYIPSRYPDALPEPLTPHLAFTSEDKRKAIECARKIIDLVKSVGEDLRRKEKEEGGSYQSS